MVETIQLAGDEYAVAQFGVTPSESIWDERILNVPARNNQCRCWVRSSPCVPLKRWSAFVSKADILAAEGEVSLGPTGDKED
jgi:hypothetical protein